MLASDLLAESLAIELTRTNTELIVYAKPDELTKHPSLIIWSIENLEALSSIQIELQRIHKNWEPTSVLLLLPDNIRIAASELLLLECAGLLQAPDIKTLNEAIKTILEGGRIVRLKDTSNSIGVSQLVPIGLGEWLLASALQQINSDLTKLERIVSRAKQTRLFLIVVNGRIRELKSARSLILWLWGPVRSKNYSKTPSSNSDRLVINKSELSSIRYGTDITLKERNSVGVWNAIQERLKQVIEGEINNSTGSLLAIEALNSTRRRDLMNALLNQLDQVVMRLRTNLNSERSGESLWKDLQLEIRQQSLRIMAGNYLQIPRGDELNPLSEQLIELTELIQVDEELPEPKRMLDPLLSDKPVLVEGQLLPSDDPRALINLEIFISNWLVRTAELISSEVLEACAEWPELRRYMLSEHLISTRELERYRNQLNSQVRWQNLIERPIRLYESKRLFYKLSQGKIEPLTITETRDDELRDLGWWQQQVALLIEARDALAPQVQSLVKRIGDLMVVLLTQVIGRAIGLIGRGIAQGMGRSLGRG